MAQAFGFKKMTAVEINEKAVIEIVKANSAREFHSLANGNKFMIGNKNDSPELEFLGVMQFVVTGELTETRRFSTYTLARSYAVTGDKIVIDTLSNGIFEIK